MLNHHKRRLAALLVWIDHLLTGGPQDRPQCEARIHYITTRRPRRT